MRRSAWAAAILTLFLSVSDLDAAELAEMVRDLNVMQNRMVTGDLAARDNAARQFELIENAIDPEDAKAWTQERNIRAAIIYLLSGGESAKLRKIQEANLFDEKFRGILAASLSYTEGETAELMAFDARQYPPMLGGHLALVQGGGIIGKDNARAVALLDLARLLMSASLVEEAAIRREIALLDPERESGKLLLLATRYVSKYIASPFAQNFWDEFRAIALGDANASSASSKLDSILDKAPPDQRVDVYLALSRRALLAGSLDWGADRLAKAEGASHDSVAGKRLDAYRLVLKGLESDQNPAALRALDVTGLKPEDVELVKIATAVATKLEARNEKGAKPSADASPDEDYPMAATIKQALAQSDELLMQAANR
jgi:chemotaxis protein MotC